MKNDKLAPVRDILGKRLDGLNLACEMMMFSFGELELHAQCFVRIIRDGEILVTTPDYQSWDGENDTNNDEWHFVAQYKENILGGVVELVEISPTRDILIRLNNGIRIEIYIANGYSHYGGENKQWVFFKRRDPAYPYITVYNKSVDVTAG